MHLLPLLLCLGLTASLGAAAATESTLSAADEGTSSDPREAATSADPPSESVSGDAAARAAASDSAVPESTVDCPNCTCVPYHLCTNFPVEIPPGKEIPIRLLEDPMCPNFLDVPCLIPLQENEPDLGTRTAAEEYVPSCGRRNPGGLGTGLEGFKVSLVRYILLEKLYHAWDILYLLRRTRRPQSLGSCNLLLY